MEQTRAAPEVRGTRAELIQELLRVAEGWQHFGKDYLYEQAVAGVESLQLQAPSVRVGHTHYIVTSA